MFNDYLIRGFCFLLGLCIGSFLNCYIYRLEEEKSLKGRSFCPHCKHTLSWQDLFPVFSFLFLMGKCRYCHKKISWQYPLVELLTGVLFVLIYNQSIGFNIIYFITISCFLIIIFVYDLKHYIIPDKVLFPAITIALANNLLLAGFSGNFVSIILNYALAIGIGSGFFLLIFLISKGQWMGFGDVKLAILMGLLLGFPNILVALFLAFLFGAIIGIILMVLPARSPSEKKGLKSEIPFGPFLIAGTFVVMLWGSQLINFYLNFLQI